MSQQMQSRRSPWPGVSGDRESSTETESAEAERIARSKQEREAFLTRLREIALSTCPNSRVLESRESWFTDELESLQAALGLSEKEISDIEVDENPNYKKLDFVETPIDEKERRILFEKSRKVAEFRFKEYPLDTDNLTRWAGALLGLAPYQSGTETEIMMIKDAILKLEMALLIQPKKHQAHWCLGNAYTSHGLLILDLDIALPFFEKAAKCYTKALHEDPENDIYEYCLKMNEKAPEVHMEMQNQRQALHDQLREEGISTTSYPKDSEEEEVGGYSNMYGWGIFAVVVVALAFRATYG